MNKALILKKASEYPQAFKILPLNIPYPKEPGTWGSYFFDNTMQFWINSSHREAISFYKYIVKMEEVYKMTKALTIQEDQQVKALIANNVKAIKSVLPKHLTPERAMRVAYTSLVKNPMLARCTQISLMNSIVEASILGLEVGGPLSHAALIPFKNNKTNAYETTLVIEYPGLIMLANNTGNVKSITAHAVFEKDDFKYNYGLNPDLHHIPCEDSNPGEIVNAYAIIQYLNGGYDFEVIGQKTASEAKGRSAAKFKKDSPWNKKEDLPAMWKKTAIRRLMNRVPKSAEIRNKMDTEDRPISHINIDLEDIQPVQLPEKTASNDVKKQEQNKPAKKQAKKTTPKPDLCKEVKQAISMQKEFPPEFTQAQAELKIAVKSIEDLTKDQAIAIGKKLNEILDSQNI